MNDDEYGFVDWFSSCSGFLAFSVSTILITVMWKACIKFAWLCIFSGRDSNRYYLPKCSKFRFLILPSSLCRIWTYESNICTGLQLRSHPALNFFVSLRLKNCILHTCSIFAFQVAGLIRVTQLRRLVGEMCNVVSNCNKWKESKYL